LIGRALKHARLGRKTQASGRRLCVFRPTKKGIYRSMSVFRIDVWFLNQNQHKIYLGYVCIKAYSDHQAKEIAEKGILYETEQLF
jgi:hypothetical protein